MRTNIPLAKAAIKASVIYCDVAQSFKQKSNTKALDNLYDSVDDLLLRSDFVIVECLLLITMQNSLPLVALVGLLTITLSWREQLGVTRNKFATHVLCFARKEKGDKQARLLLKGLI